MRHFLICLSFILIALSSNAFAEDGPRLRFPMECELGDDCWLMNLPDTDPAKESFKDYTCGSHTYDGHDGTDIAIRDQAAMTKGVDVLAAQAGTVARVRDGVEDKFSNLTEQAEIKKDGKDCGNGIIIDHANNWTTQYCHLKKGSLKVKPGDKVEASRVIAQIGLSGITDHPHLHLAVRYKGTLIDPFTGAELTAGCGHDKNVILPSSWAERIPTDGFNLYDAGFSADTPDFALISQGIKPDPASYKSTKLIFWFAYFAALKGDRIDLSIHSPSGRVVADYQTLQPINKARQYLFTGKAMPAGLPEKGVYKGEARVTRVNLRGETRTETITRELEIK